MIINIDGREYTLTPETQTQLLMQLQAFEIQAYQGLDETLRFLLKPLARHMLSKYEDRLRREIGKEEAARICRPGKTATGAKEDPVLHFLSMHMAMSQMMLGNAEITIDTSGDNTITNCHITAPENQSGRQVAAHGDERQREDNRAEVSGRGIFAALPVGQALHP